MGKKSTIRSMGDASVSFITRQTRSGGAKSDGEYKGPNIEFERSSEVKFGNSKPGKSKK